MDTRYLKWTISGDTMYGITKHILYCIIKHRERYISYLTEKTNIPKRCSLTIILISDIRDDCKKACDNHYDNLIKNKILSW